MSKARADIVSLVHAQQYQKQQGNSTAILARSCKFGLFNPQRSTLLIDRQQHLFVARFRSTIIDPDTSPVDRYSLTTVDRRHSSSIDRHFPSNIDRYSSQASIDTEPRDMVATLILVRDDKGDLHDHEGHLRNAAGREAARRRFRSRKSDEFRRITLVLIDARLRTSIDGPKSKSIDRISIASIDDTYGVNRILQCREDSDS
ncbi:hypothetical protein F2Q69_00037157 [Brassica cretica]|uniref:Uncharacterized protein n=1 Tax=Brassica cretica TaxID=69181 RepID=A0A8S9SDC4_BRACR|nr:hypothetical protein F2Q69_00037157 [Brassica cretica]